MSKKKKKNISTFEKATHRDSIRVLYKEPNKPPKVKIIPNVFALKKAIIKRKLDIIPYQNVYIVCHNKKQMRYMPFNVIFDLYNISGDLIIVEINRNTREFQSISQENIIWYTEDLMNKSYNNSSEVISKVNIPKNFMKIYDRDFDREYDSKLSTFDFEKNLISVLVNIEMTLSTLLRNGDKK